ncbi:MAG TPA: glycosyltransferase [Vicinamibacterales bacterium]|nr:glycosyltransferase [Vicinamibacterales bacterium]
MKVALVHDWLTGMRGGEKVLEAIAELYPDAVLHTLLHVPGSVSAAIERHPIRHSFVQHLPGAARHYRQYLPLFPFAIEQFDFDGCDLVISTSHCAAKAVIVPGRARHLCYCHSPMRYAWDQFEAYFGVARVGRVRAAVLRRVMARLARWDAATAGRVDRFLANSQYVAARIRRYYNRGSSVVYPPVDTEFFQPGPARASAPYFLVVSALVPYKRLDLAIAASQRAGVRLKVVGSGPEAGVLRAISGPDVEWLGWLADDEVRALYQGCTAVLMPGIEDFGMVPVEAQACGRPVVALARGGALETILDGVTGRLVEEPSVNAWAAALRDTLTHPFDAATIRRHAESFSKQRFQHAFQAEVEHVLRAPKQADLTPDGSGVRRAPLAPDDPVEGVQVPRPALRETRR